MRKVIDTLVLDLDNTIFDWFAFWYASFEPIYAQLIKESGLPPAEVEEAVRRVHQRRRTSEYTFLLEEIDILAALRSKASVRDVFKEAIERSREGRDRNLSLYPSVFRSLWEIKKKGTKIIAYTESMRFYSAYRLKRFGLDGVIDVLFSPQDHDRPSGIKVEQLRTRPDEFYELQVTEAQHTPIGELKPNPRVLLDIIQHVGATPAKCAYVGDSLFKDVAMARDAGVLDIHAEYGESQLRPEYALLQRVSHWTEQDVDRERAITAKGANFKPSVVLKESFAEIFMSCDFVSFSNASTISAEQESKNAIEIWKKCVDVHQHFNDLEMRIRNIAITVVGALIAAVSFTYQQGLQVSLLGHSVPAGLGLVAAAIFAWCGFFLMDRFWYHILLKGAVKHSAKIEEKYGPLIPGIELGKTISEASGGVSFFSIKMNSDRRLNAFYFLGFLMLAAIFSVLLFAKSERPSSQTARPAMATIPSESPKQ